MMNVLQGICRAPGWQVDLEIWRQEHKGYKAAVAAIAKGALADGFNKLIGLGWIHQTDSNKALVDDYMAALASKKPGRADKDRVGIVVTPTHAEGDEITAAIRTRLKEHGGLVTTSGFLKRLFP